MAGIKAISKPKSKSKLRPGKNVTLNVSKAIKHLEDAKNGHSDVLDSYDNVERMHDESLKNASHAEKRNNLIKSVEERADEIDRQNKQREKDIGASKSTIQTLKHMSADEFTFIQLCDRWNRGEPGVKTSKKVFEELMAEEQVEWNAVMTEAWRNRPLGCQSLRSALLLYSKQFVDLRRTNGSEFLVPGDLPVINIDKEKLHNDYLAVTVLTKLESITQAIQKLDGARKESKLNEYFPGCFGLCQRQVTSVELRQIEFHMGGFMDKEDLYTKFPTLRPLFTTKPQASDVDHGFSSTRPPSPSLIDHEKLEAAEREVQRLRMINDKEEEDEGEDEDMDEGGGYDGEQGDLFRQVFGGEEGEEGEEGEAGEEGEEAEQAAPEPIQHEASEPEQAATFSVSGDSEHESTSDISKWKHDDEDMMFAEAMAAGAIAAREEAIE